MHSAGDAMPRPDVKCGSIIANLPVAPPITPAPTAASQQRKQDQQCDRADGGNDDHVDEAAADMDAELRQQPAADEGADYADGDVADQAEAAAGDDFSCEPAGNEADKQNDE